MLRVLSGSSRTAVSPITAPICVLVVSTCVASPNTWIVSEAPPTESAISTTATWPMVTTTLLSAKALNPVARADTVYVPTGSSGNS